VTIDIASIVPSVRDFLQAIDTRRKRLALVPLVEGPDEARNLADAGVNAFAMQGPSDGMRAVSAALGSVPLLSLAPVGDEQAAMMARAAGADAVIVPLDGDAAVWDATAKRARTTHMATLVRITDTATAEIAARTHARGAYVAIDSASDARAIVGLIGSMRVIARLPSVDETALRALRGIVDAVIVESDLYLSTSFESLRDELDP
jgi:hypothetical protein